MKYSTSQTMEVLQRSMIRGNEVSHKHKINLYCHFFCSKIPRNNTNNLYNSNLSYHLNEIKKKSVNNTGSTILISYEVFPSNIILN